MSKLLTGLAIAVIALSSSACTHVTSGQPGANNVTQDAWYVKTTFVLWVPTGSSVYYCPKENPTRCVEAEMQE